MVFYNDTVEVFRPVSKTNRAQESVLDYSALRAEIVAGAAGVPRAHVQVRPTGQSENVDDDRDADISDYAIATRPGTGDWDVRADDWIRLPSGIIAKLVGQPARPSNPMGGGVHHVEIRVREVR